MVLVKKGSRFSVPYFAPLFLRPIFFSSPLHSLLFLLLRARRFSKKEKSTGNYFSSKNQSIKHCVLGKAEKNLKKMKRGMVFFCVENPCLRPGGCVRSRPRENGNQGKTGTKGKPEPRENGNDLGERRSNAQQRCNALVGGKQIPTCDHPGTNSPEKYGHKRVQGRSLKMVNKKYYPPAHAAYEVFCFAEYSAGGLLLFPFF